MAEKAETRLAQKCIAWVKENGGDAHHVHGSAAQRAGEPDIDGAILLPSGSLIHFKIELKVGDNQPTKLQESRLEKYRRFGYTTGVANSLESFIALVMNGTKLNRSIWNKENEFVDQTY